MTSITPASGAWRQRVVLIAALFFILGVAALVWFFCEFGAPVIVRDGTPAQTHLSLPADATHVNLYAPYGPATYWEFSTTKENFLAWIESEKIRNSQLSEITYFEGPASARTVEFDAPNLPQKSLDLLNTIRVTCANPKRPDNACTYIFDLDANRAYVQYNSH